ncbi:MAG: hypothetical protein JWR69_3405, partial [Pedosphaera sp.]|nr:hypothetical protein [Pedosphaera sp.]
NNPAHSSKNFILGENFVVFTNVVPADGVINGTWSPVVNPFSNLSGEGNFCGMQLVTGNHPPVAPTLAVSAPPAQLVTWAPVSGILQSAPSPTGPWTDIPGATSPYVGSGALSYRVLGN